MTPIGAAGAGALEGTSSASVFAPIPRCDTAGFVIVVGGGLGFVVWVTTGPALGEVGAVGSDVELVGGGTDVVGGGVVVVSVGVEVVGGGVELVGGGTDVVVVGGGVVVVSVGVGHDVNTKLPLANTLLSVSISTL